MDVLENTEGPYSFQSWIEWIYIPTMLPPPACPPDVTVVGLCHCVIIVAGESKLSKLGFGDEGLPILVNHYAIVQLHLNVGYETKYELLIALVQFFKIGSV